jgi:sulfur-oxidizing protein SoxY
MHTKISNGVIDRRSVLGCLIVALATPAVFVRSAHGVEEAAQPSAAYLAAYGKIVGQRKPDERAVRLDLPEIAENGNIVPYRIDVDHPMDEASYVRAIHLLSTANPQPHVATFHLTLLSGSAAVSGRMRLAKTQEVVVLAELNDGRLLMGKRVIEVTIGGCEN